MPQFLSPRNLTLPALLALSAASALAADATPAAGLHSFHETSVLGTSLDVTFCTAAPADADAARTALLAEIARLDAILSTYRNDTDLARLNASHDPVKVSHEVIDVLTQYNAWTAKSHNAFSGRLGGVVALWKNAEKTNTPPTAAQIAAALEAVKAPLWRIDATAGTVQRTGDAAINIDSLGKGFIASHAAEVTLRQYPSLRGIMLNIGGDIVALGSSSLTASAPWTVGISDPAHPADNAAPLTTLHLQDLAIATSGNYERGYTIAGKKYSHLLDPRTAAPVDFGPPLATGVASATVVAKDAATANALAASLNVLHPGEGLDLIASVPGAQALIVLNNGTQMRSPGFKALENAPIAEGKGWADGYQLSLALQFADPAGGRRPERPYVAVWIENAAGEHITTLAEWGNNPRWMNSLGNWWRDARPTNDLLRAVSRATRPAGKYTLTWNGTDFRGQPVAAGAYKVFVEFAYDHNGHSVSSATITCDGAAATATVPHSQHFDDVALTYAAKAK